MLARAINFETLQDMCKHGNDHKECNEEDNYSGKCECSECPVWNELSSSQIDL